MGCRSNIPKAVIATFSWRCPKITIRSCDAAVWLDYPLKRESSLPSAVCNCKLNLPGGVDSSCERTILGNAIKESILGHSTEVATNIPLLLSNFCERYVRLQTRRYIVKAAEI